MLLFKSKKTNKLTNFDKKNILKLKNEFWKKGIKSQKEWFKRNIKTFDIHNPSELPDVMKIKKISEPIIKARRSREIRRISLWRRERDSNPRNSFLFTRFPSVRLQPLGHLSS